LCSKLPSNFSSKLFTSPAIIPTAENIYTITEAGNSKPRIGAQEKKFSKPATHKRHYA